MKIINLWGMLIVVALVCASFSACSKSSDSDTYIDNAADYEKKIVGIWTGTYSSDLSIVFKRYIFDDSHVVRLYTKTGSRTSTTSNGVTKYSNWQIKEENQVGEWIINDKGHTADLHIEYNSGSRLRESFSLFNFSGAKLNNGGSLTLYKGDSNPDF